MAISMISLLLWKGPKFAAAVGMCGWVPLKARIEQAVQDNEGKILCGTTDPFYDVCPAL
jgi:hypothetical protein